MVQLLGRFPIELLGWLQIALPGRVLVVLVYLILNVIETLHYYYYYYYYYYY